MQFEGPVVEWRGPAPFYFVAIPAEESADIKFAAKGLEYWGQVPVVVRIGEIEFTTALFPREGNYFLPLRDAVRSSAGIELDEVVAVWLSVGRQQTRCPPPEGAGPRQADRRVPVSLPRPLDGSRWSWSVRGGAEPTRARP